MNELKPCSEDTDRGRPNYFIEWSEKEALKALYNRNWLVISKTINAVRFYVSIASLCTIQDAEIHINVDMMGRKAEEGVSKHVFTLSIIYLCFLPYNHI